MALFWFVLALVLLVVALFILRLDAKQRGGGSDGARPGVDRGRAWAPGAGDEGAPVVVVDVGESGNGRAGDAPVAVGLARGAGGEGLDDDEDLPLREPAEHPEAATRGPVDAVAPKLAPFQRGAGAGSAARAGAGDGSGAEPGMTEPGMPGPDAASLGGADSAEAVESRIDRTEDVVADTRPDTAGHADPAPDADDVADEEALTAAASGVGGAGAVESGPTPPGESEPAAEPAPRLLDRVRALLPTRRPADAAVEQAAAEPVDPLAGSPVVRWLEDREFAPTPTPAPEFLHGDFAGGLSALGTVSHGVFRGRRAIMGVTSGRTVLALRRDTASDVILDLSRPDVDAEPGFHDAGEIGSLEARTSDYGRCDLLDRDRLAAALTDVPASVRRIWAEGEWVAATIDGVDDPTGWDDVVMALHGAADVVAPLPPIGGRARALPAEIDPGSPAAAEGPEADPTMGMDGEVGTGSTVIAPLPDPEDHVVVDTDSAPGADVAGGSVGRSGAGEGDAATATTAPTTAFPVPGAEQPGQAGSAGAAPRRGGHLRLVPDRPAARDLSDVPVVADRGDAPAAADSPAVTGSVPAPEAPAAPDTAGPTGDDGPVDPMATAAAAADADSPGTVAAEHSSAATGDEVAADDAAATEPAVEETDPFAEIMEPSAPVEARGDVAADHLAPRPPLSRPTRGLGQTFPEDASVPPLAAGVATGGAAIKPLGSEDDEDEIREEVERFDAARIDGRSDFDQPSAGRHEAPGEGSGGRHGADELDPSEVTQRLSVAELAARMGIDPSEMRSQGRRRRRAAAEGDAAGTCAAAPGATEPVERAQGRERPGIDPDVEQTARLHLPPDIRD